MTKCPQCQLKMDFDFLNEIMDELSQSRSVIYETIVQATCCSKKLKAINDCNTYYIISEPAKEGEERDMIGAK
jgi:multimeric flavodoxin WrbA